MSYKDADLLKLYAQGKRDIPNLLFPDAANSDLQNVKSDTDIF